MANDIFQLDENGDWVSTGLDRSDIAKIDNQKVFLCEVIPVTQNIHQYLLTGNIHNGTFKKGTWSGANIDLTRDQSVTGLDNKLVFPSYDSTHGELNPIRANIYNDTSTFVNISGLTDFPISMSIKVWYWYTLQDEDVLSDYIQEDIVTIGELDQSGYLYTAPNVIEKEIGGIKVGDLFQKTPISYVLDRLLFPKTIPSITVIVIFADASVSHLVRDGAKLYEAGNVAGKTMTQVRVISTFPDWMQGISILFGIFHHGNNIFASAIISMTGSTFIDLNIVSGKEVLDMGERAICVFQDTNLNLIYPSYDSIQAYDMFFNYYGSSNLDTLNTLEDIQSLGNSKLSSFVLNETYSFGSGYKYFVTRGWTINTWIDVQTGLPVPFESGVLVGTFPNQYGVSCTYYAYRSTNKINGSLSIRLM